MLKEKLNMGNRFNWRRLFNLLFFIAYTKEYAHYIKKNIFGTVGTRLGTGAAKSGTGLGQSNKNKLK